MRKLGAKCAALRLTLLASCLGGFVCQESAREPMELQITNETYVESSSVVRLSEVASYDTDRRSPATATCEVTSSCDDIAGFEAIRALHRQLDDDASGTVDISETDEFIRDELQNPNGNERQIKAFHGTDTSISVLEMWLGWKNSEVHNWTVEETVSWLVDCVDLPQYARVFHENRVDGRALPRMAVQSNAYLSSELGIKDPISKQKLVLKAMDVVLFGPQRNHNWLKDVILAVVICLACMIVWYLYNQKQSSDEQVSKLMKELDGLLEMQQQLDKARSEAESPQEDISGKKEGLAYNDPEMQIYKLQEEIRFLHEELAKAQNVPRGMAPPQLQHWLQLTHEIELKYFHAKKAAAENQLRKAKDECDKLRRKGQSFMGPFRLTHGGSIDDIDTTILKAKQALIEVSNDKSERLHRWRQIELLCGCNITLNCGLVQLEALLHGRVIIANPAHGHSSHGNNSNTPTAGSTKSVISRSGSEGTLSGDDSPGSSSYNNNNNISSVASTASMSVMSSKAANTVYGVPPSGRRVGVQQSQSLYGDYYAQQIMQQTMHGFHHSSGSGGALASSGIGGMPMVPMPGTPPGNNSAPLSAVRREEPDGDLTPQVGHTSVSFHVGANGTSPTSENGSAFAAPVMSSSRGVLLKGTSIDGSTDGALDDEPNANRISSAKPKRKGSKRRSALMNAIRSSLTSATTLVDSEDNSSRGSTPALDDNVSQKSIRKKTGVFGAIKKMSRGNKDKTTADRDS
ncbi:stromal interaction molecule 1-like isoform X5 [Varroa jacobsoni]|uniref:SAM domain-containing protein n=1 Tax=Varroa destructor TaxID=109461 RepID=A0A7M7KDL9_VARDE|nr:stromal interaction molecule 1-like isoform X6 [Varroa destructor]XP_022687465.1 stromal interaction molecule 1-like isoform X5 [Varroa jacobsoni]